MFRVERERRTRKQNIQPTRRTSVERTKNARGARLYRLAAPLHVSRHADIKEKVILRLSLVDSLAGGMVTKSATMIGE